MVHRGIWILFWSVIVVAYFLARCNWFCMHESTGEPNLTQYITNNIFYTSDNMAIMTQFQFAWNQLQLLWLCGPYLEQWSRSNEFRHFLKRTSVQGIKKMAHVHKKTFTRFIQSPTRLCLTKKSDIIEFERGDHTRSISDWSLFFFFHEIYSESCRIMSCWE